MKTMYPYYPSQLVPIGAVIEGNNTSPIKIVLANMGKVTLTLEDGTEKEYAYDQCVYINTRLSPTAERKTYMNSDKYPVFGDKIKNCGQIYNVRGVSDDGMEVYVVGHNRDYWLNTGCSILIERAES